MGHLKAMFWFRHKGEEPKVNVALEKINEIGTHGSAYQYDSSLEDLHVVMESSEEEDDDLMALKQDAKGHALMKYPRSERPMAIESLLNPGRSARAVTKNAPSRRKGI